MRQPDWVCSACSCASRGTHALARTYMLIALLDATIPFIMVVAWGTTVCMRDSAIAARGHGFVSPC